MTTEVTTVGKWIATYITGKDGSLVQSIKITSSNTAVAAPPSAWGGNPAPKALVSFQAKAAGTATIGYDITSVAGGKTHQDLELIVNEVGNSFVLTAEEV